MKTTGFLYPYLRSVRNRTSRLRNKSQNVPAQQFFCDGSRTPEGSFMKNSCLLR
jgi:hypothetical protein